MVETLYIYKTKHQDGVLNFNIAMQQLNTYYEQTKLSYMINNNLEIFQETWKNYEKLFID